MRVADIAVIGILFGGASVGILFLLAKQDMARTDWANMSPEDSYVRLCATCHNVDGTATNSTANTLKGKRRYWDEEKLVEYMENPIRYALSKSGGRLGRQTMTPIPSHVPLETRQKIAQYVLNVLMD
jgi:cytochrome c2